MDLNDTTNPAEAEDIAETEVETPEETLDDDAEAPEGEQAQAQEEDEELDIDGEALRLPKSLAEKLRSRMMMNADYTQKTQAIAEQRREFEAQRQAAAMEEHTRQELFHEEAQLYSLRSELESFQNVNWQQWAAQNPQQAFQAQARYTQLRDMEERLSGHVEGRKAELSQAREQETAIVIHRAMESLNKPNSNIGWDGKFDEAKRTSLTSFGLELGFTNEELSNTTHPLMIQTLNLARIGFEALRKQSAALKKPVSEAKPVTKVTTGKARAAFDPEKLEGDAWVKWREAQIAKKQARFR